MLMRAACPLITPPLGAVMALVIPLERAMPSISLPVLMATMARI